MKAVFFDGTNTARRYIEENGSDDSALKFSYYYDAKKALRFVFIEGGAVNGSEMEHRIGRTMPDVRRHSIEGLS